MNKAILVGVVCDEPKYKVTDSGFTVLRYNVKTVDEFLNRDGEVQSRDAYHRCVAFGNLAKLRRGLHEHQMVSVEGRMETRKYQNNDGDTKTVHQVVANSMGLLFEGPPDKQPGEPEKQPAEAPAEEWGDDDIPF